MQFARIALWLSLLTFAGFGFAFTAFPNHFASFVGIVLPSDTAKIDFMATYGGFELGFAAFLWTCTRKVERVRLGLLASGWALSGFAATRFLGIAISGPVRPIIWLLLFAELSGSLLSFWFARRIARSP